ncbi:hypothetical protein [Sphingomonas sp.]|uniref:hypothetical protein n=1 Tax=Sphingomonas sp. TaxID=28214 RepID=UPI003F721614
MNRRSILAVIAVAPAVAIPAAAIASPSSAWDRLMAERNAAEAEYRRADSFYNPASDVDTDRLDYLCERYCDLEDRLMTMPAPNHAALRWKLEKLLEIGDTGTSAWAKFYVEQTHRDIARLLA